MLHDFATNYEMDEDEFSMDLEHMHLIYTGNLPLSQANRFSAYLNGDKDTFLAQPAHEVTCSECYAHFWTIGLMVGEIECPSCHEKSEKFDATKIRVDEIPPWLDIDSFSWKEEENEPIISAGSPPDDYPSHDHYHYHDHDSFSWK